MCVFGLKGWKDDMMHNSLVYGCIKNGRYREAFKVMSLVKPNAVALTSVLVCCSEESDLLTGKQVHSVAVLVEGFVACCSGVFYWFLGFWKLVSATVLLGCCLQGGFLLSGCASAVWTSRLGVLVCWCLLSRLSEAVQRLLFLDFHSFLGGFCVLLFLSAS